MEAKRAPRIGGWSDAREAHPAVVGVEVDARITSEREPAVVDLLVPARELGDGGLRHRGRSGRRTRPLLDVGSLTLLIEGVLEGRRVRTVSGTRTPMFGRFCGVQQVASPVGVLGFPADQPRPARAFLYQISGKTQNELCLWYTSFQFYASRYPSSFASSALPPNSP